MATLALSAIGSAIGSSLLPAGFSVLGTTITGATIGAQVGALAGSFVDEALFGGAGQSRTFEGPRLEDLRVMASSEGAPIPRIYGRARVGGQLIWATDFEEEKVTEEAGGQSKGSLGGGGGTKTVTYKYFANFAVALGEGEITGIGRVWADGQEWDLSDVTYRVYFGSETQEADSLIAARQTDGAPPAYRGTAYVVFEHMPLEPFGNRLPQLSFEVFRAVDDLHERIKGTVVIPGSGEFVYATTPVQRTEFLGEQVAENVHTREAETDWLAAMDQMQRSLPNVQSVSLVTSWFGTDLRAGQCEIKPGVERVQKETRPLVWQVAGVDRANAYVVSQNNGRPAYGGTPSDQTVIEAIGDLKARGIGVILTPFVLMDIADGNQLDDPYTGSGSQPVYPWRGRITVDPAPGVAGSPDKTAVAAAQVAAFIGTAAVGDFSVVGSSVAYQGPNEWSFRRFVLHYAHLAAAAGGVDAFVIGTEMRGLTWVRDGAASYPFVQALAQLAADVKSVLGAGTKVTYAADWSEYFGHQPADGSGDVLFHLDSLWASPDIDAVGIDLYWPLSDWREGRNHLDAARARSIYDLDYLKSNIAGGEGYDWYYASDAHRQSQQRTLITDAAGKPWVFRYKDLASWWSNAHYDRPGGIEQASPTAWQPQSKPVWLMESGCPAIDKGANQPNVFYDPKSSESFLPFFAELRRDDLMQRVYLQALIEGFDPDHTGYVSGLNPVSTVYGGPMVDPARIHVYAWDARGYPAFPGDAETWGDAPNWSYGHWINGRIASMPLGEALGQLFADFGFGDVDLDAVEGILPGYIVDRVMSLREALQPIEMAFFIDSIESGDQVVLRHRGRSDVVGTFDLDALVAERPEAALLTVTRGQETELPAAAKITHMNASGDYRANVAESRRLAGYSERVASASLAMMLEPDQAHAIAETWLHEAWASRRRATFGLPPSALAIEPGDLVETIEEGRRLLHRVVEISDHGARSIEALSVAPSIYEQHAAPQRSINLPAQPVIGTADAMFLDLPLLLEEGAETDGFVALHQAPWPGPLALYRSPGDDGYTYVSGAEASATIGRLLDPLPAGAVGRLDYASRVRVELASGMLTSISRLALLEGGNAMAVLRDDGSWEVLQFETANLIGVGTYELSGLLRGQLGTDIWHAIGDQLAAPNGTVVLIDRSLVRVPLDSGDTERPFNWRYGPAARDIGHGSYAQATHSFAGIGRRPFAPVHVKGRRLGDDLEISWVRRTRTGGDNWDQAEVALGEEGEAYEVDILDGASVVRILSTSQPAASYMAVEQTADFGSPQPTVSCRVYQLSASWGRGAARVAVV